MTRLRPKTNEVVVGDNEDLFSRIAVVRDFHWISGTPPASPIRCRAKIRYRQKEEDAELALLPDGSVRIRFDAPQRAITPGQAAVVYDGDEVLGGGTIVRSEKE